MPPKGILLMTVGLPHSGKSTWAMKQSHPVVNPDSVRLALHGKAFIKEAEKMVWVIVHYMIRALFLAGHTHVILDACNTSRKRRDDFKSSMWNRHYVNFPTKREECIDRAHKAKRGDLIQPIERMAANFEPVSTDEYDDIDKDA